MGKEVSLEVKIGQMLMVGFRGLEVDAGQPIIQDIQERYLGGVVLFDYDVPTGTPSRNIQSPAQVKALVTRLQSFSTIPLLVAIDQEGGKVCRLKEEFGFPPTVSAQALGRLNDLAATYEQATQMAKTLVQLGINLNLAPVVDLATTPNNPIASRERSFSADPKLVTAHARQFISAHHTQGVLCTLKHFPGHGSSTGDSHFGLADVTQTWSAAELEPYADMIKAGEADAVMTAHVFNTNLDPEYPATLSKPIITGLLRQGLNYDGVVISDDMQMRAITDHYGFETAIQAAIEVGVDMIAVANNSVYDEDVAARAVALIKQLAHTGKISEARIDESYRRIQRLKRKLHST
jgi:beta-N-acetylhexosaminidase